MLDGIAYGCVLWIYAWEEGCEMDILMVVFIWLRWIAVVWPGSGREWCPTNREGDIFYIDYEMGELDQLVESHRPSLLTRASFLPTFSYLVSLTLLVSFVSRYQSRGGTNIYGFAHMTGSHRRLM